MKKLGIFAALVAVLAFPASSLALVIPGTEDQHQDSGPNGQIWNSGIALAQTFTAGLTGSLDAVTVNVGDVAPQAKPAGARPAALGDLNIGIFATSGGSPTGGPLAVESFTGITTATLIVVTFSSPTHVTAGTQYAIVMAPGASSFVDWLGQCDGNPYAGGEARVLDTDTSPNWLTLPAWATAADSSACINDFEFATYVTVGATPPPTATAVASVPARGDSSIVLLAAAFGLLAAYLTIRRVRAVRG